MSWSMGAYCSVIDQGMVPERGTFRGRYSSLTLQRSSIAEILRLNPTLIHVEKLRSESFSEDESMTGSISSFPHVHVE